MLEITNQSIEGKVNRKNLSVTKDMFLHNIMTFTLSQKHFKPRYHLR